MRIRCSDPCCNDVIDFKRHYVHVDGQYFCSSDCTLQKLEADRRLAQVGDRFHAPKRKKPVYFGSQEDYGDCDPMPQKPPL